MGYRSLQRVLGETNLERKCRLLFGTCLFLLITATFLWVDMIAENQVINTNKQKLETARQTARSFASTGLLKLHFKSLPAEEEDYDRTDRERLFELTMQGLESQDYQHAILAEESTDLTQGILESERPVFDRLQARMKDQRQRQALQRAELSRSDNSATGSKSGPDEFPRSPDEEDAEGAADNEVVYEEQLTSDDQGDQYYVYYQPVYWTDTCTHCHPRHGSTSLTAAEADVLDEQEPLRVVRVIIPYEYEGQTAVNRIRAILTSASIVTFFLAMVALYLIVRYVVVKPLQHLRNVSDDISRGKTELRAEIHTKDEFEDLADSFNRMLRHLTDTQANLRAVNEDLDAKVDELAQLNMRLYEMNRLKSDFLANMSHELRTPLNSIIGFSEVLGGIDSLNDKQKRYAKNIQKSGRVLLEMINDILDLAKVESGKMDIKPSEFRVDAIVQAQCDMVRSLTEEKNIDLEVHIQPDIPELYQDQSKVQQILTNLLSNAIKFTPEGGRIEVRAERLPQEMVRLTVADTGVGIPEEDREIIFEKFRQSETVLGSDGLTREYSGTGLGLSIVKELSKLLGGEIDFQSEVGHGSTFQVTLPCVVPTQDSRSRTAAKLDEITQPPGLPAGASRW